MNQQASYSRGKDSNEMLFKTPHQIDKDKTQDYYQTGQYISSSTLQHSSPSIAFTKAQRFHEEQEAILNYSKFVIPDTKSLRSTSFGYGTKQMNHTYISKNAEANPGPNHYFSKMIISQNNKNGPSMKGGFSNSQYLPNLTQISPQQAKHLPGPGTYNIEKAAGSTVAKFSMALKWRQQQNINLQPSSSDYNPKRNLIEKSRYQNIGLGYGKKYDLTSGFEKTPGPGTYSIKSNFDSPQRRRSLVNQKRINVLKKSRLLN